MSDEPEGFTEFVRLRSGPLLRTAYLLCAGDRAAAEDLLQDVLERLYPKWRRIRGSPEAYARAALANAATNRWRRRGRRPVETELTPAADRDGPVPQDRVDDRDALVTALAGLAPGQRAAVVLRYFDDLTEAETAAALNCRVGTVKSQTARGLARLRQLLAEPTTSPEGAR
ncbi:MAG TPA: SigE family RNA polymerase sigma factor [Pseudonocardiaceae bacterium]